MKTHLSRASYMLGFLIPLRFCVHSQRKAMRTSKTPTANAPIFTCRYPLALKSEYSSLPTCLVLWECCYTRCPTFSRCRALCVIVTQCVNACCSTRLSLARLSWRNSSAPNLSDAATYTPVVATAAHSLRYREANLCATRAAYHTHHIVYVLGEVPMSP